MEPRANRALAKCPAKGLRASAAYGNECVAHSSRTPRLMDTLRSPLILLCHLPRDFGEGFQA